MANGMGNKVYQRDLFSAVNTAESVSEKVSKFGVEYCNNIDLIEAVIAPYVDISVDSHELAFILQDSMNGLDSLTVEKLMNIKGVTPQMATTLLIAVELGRRMGNIKSKKTVVCPADIHKAIRHLASDEQESMIAVGLNGAHEIIYTQVVTTGLLNKTIVHPREVFSRAIRDRCCAIAIAHNHPSGNIEPSSDDKDVTVRLQKAGDILGIKLLDHLVFTDEKYYSFLEHGMM